MSEEIPRERSGRPDVDPQREARPQQFVIGNDEAELELSDRNEFQMLQKMERNIL